MTALASPALQPNQKQPNRPKKRPQKKAQKMIHQQTIASVRSAKSNSNQMLALLLLGVFSICASFAQAQDKPNIVYVICDDLGYGDVPVSYTHLTLPTKA